LTDVNRPATAVRPLPELLESLRAKGLRRGVGPMVGEAVAEPSPSNRGAIPTGFGALDEALRTGGWPRGSLALLDAPRGAGATSLARVAAGRLALEREAWLAVGRDLVGQRIRATVTRHRWALAGETASLDLWFGEGRRIDALLPPLAVPREAAPALAPVAVATAVAETEPEDQPDLRILSA